MPTHLAVSRCNQQMSMTLRSHLPCKGAITPRLQRQPKLWLALLQLASRDILELPGRSKTHALQKTHVDRLAGLSGCSCA